MAAVLIAMGAGPSPRGLAIARRAATKLFARAGLAGDQYRHCFGSGVQWPLEDNRTAGGLTIASLASCLRRVAHLLAQVSSSDRAADQLHCSWARPAGWRQVVRGSRPGRRSADRAVRPGVGGRDDHRQAGIGAPMTLLEQFDARAAPAFTDVRRPGTTVVGPARRGRRGLAKLRRVPRAPAPSSSIESGCDWSSSTIQMGFI